MNLSLGTAHLYKILLHGHQYGLHGWVGDPHIKDNCRGRDYFPSPHFTVYSLHYT